MRLSQELHRRYHYGSAPSGAISVAAFGLVARGRFTEHGELRLCSRAARQRLGDYFDALEGALGSGWLEASWRCTVRDAVQAGAPLSMALPCMGFHCSNNLLGHLDRFGLPVVYHPSVAGRLTCILQLGAALTLAEIGKVLGICRERCRQLEVVGLQRARIRGRRLVAQ